MEIDCSNCFYHGQAGYKFPCAERIEGGTGRRHKCPHNQAAVCHTCVLDYLTCGANLYAWDREHLWLGDRKLVCATYQPREGSPEL